MNTRDHELFKQRITRYVKDGKRVPAGTPGAEKVVVESKKWYVAVKNPKTGKWERMPLATDKQAARQKLAKLERKLARQEAGLADPYEEAMEGDIVNHVKVYLTDLEERGRDERYREQTRREIDKVVDACHTKTLKDLTADKVDDFLTGLTCSARTKNSYRQAVLGLCNYLVRKRKLPFNPLLVTTRRKGEVKRKRRALPAEALQILLNAARTRPLLEAMTIRRGPRKGQQEARVAPEYREQLDRIGRHRALLYLAAVHTGLRLGALRHLKVCYLDLDGPRQHLVMPGRYMKSGRDFTQLLRADLVAELKAWLSETGKGREDLVFDIPAYTQVSKLLKKDLKKAGIPYQDVRGRYFDFHSFRKCTGSFLRQKAVDPSVSKRYLDHSDIRMTLEVYNDEELLEMGEALDAIPSLSIR